jgi:hypothetical protein
VEISFLTVHHLGWLSPKASLDRKEIGAAISPMLADLATRQKKG